MDMEVEDKVLVTCNVVLLLLLNYLTREELLIYILSSYCHYYHVNGVNTCQ